MLNIHHIIHQTRTEGPGLRCCIWLQGCSIHCEGCFARDTWAFEERSLIHPVDIINNMRLTEEGITICGGEPFDQKEDVAELCRLADCKGLSTVVYTGRTLETLQSMDDEYINIILKHTDLLIDGPFVRSKLSTSFPLIGSTNQRLIFLSKRYTWEDIRKNQLEIRIQQNGSMSINGMADDSYINQIVSI